MDQTLDPARWERLRTLFSAAVDSGDLERRRQVDHLSQDDPELARLLADLLSVHGAFDGDTASERLRWLQAASRVFESLRTGDRVGGFVLRQLIGRGGMGVVYRADRVDGHVTQQVAIKFVAPAMLDATALRRFRVERDTIASLRHPNIARLFDAGTTPDGVPFAVMELVDGVPITRWCDDRRLSVSDRLSLLATVCDAVQSAHDNLILHRDIKPANVLVAPDGHVKLIDFGIAAPLGPAGAGVAEGSDAPMTAAYAAPEQIRRERLDVRCDVYQLGALAYELVSGAPPDRRSVGADRTIRPDEPPPPSRVAVAASTTSARARGVRDGAVLSRRLRGDIDAIVRRCLRDDPGLRYPTVADLASDLRRCVAGEAVAVRRDQVGYRLAKFVRRHAPAVAGGCLVVLLVAFSLAREWSTAAALARQAERLQAQKELADRAVDFAATIFQAADPSAGLSPDAPARELLQRASERIERELADDPAVRGRLQRVLAESWMGMEEHALALEAARNAVQASTVVADAVDEAIAAHLVAGRAHGMLRQRAESITAAAQALGLHLARGDDEVRSWRARLDLLVAIAGSSGRGAVVGQMEQLVERLEAVAAAEPEAYATFALQLARYRDQRQAPWGDGPRAEALATAAWEAYFDRLPAHDLRRVDARARVGAILENSGRHEEGIAWMNESLADYRRVLGEQSVSAAALLIHLGNAYVGWGKRDLALQRFAEARAEFRAVEGGRPTEGAAVAAYSLAQQHANGGIAERAAAKAAFRDAIMDAIASFGPWHPNTIVFRIGYGDFLMKVGDWAEAMRQLEIADRIFDFRRSNPPRYVDLLEATLRAGRLDTASARLEAANGLALDAAQRERLESLRGQAKLPR